MKRSSQSPIAAYFSIALVTITYSQQLEAAVICSSPDLPPSCGEYVPTGGSLGTFSNPAPGVISVTVINTSLGEFLNPVITPLAGGDELEEFEATLNGLAQVETVGGPSVIPVTLTGPVQVVTSGKTGNITGTFASEIISMSLTGSAGGFNISLRESPTLASLGQTTITDIGGGSFEIDSFSDLFTEVSLNAGPWTPVGSGTTVTLVPEPSSALLSVLGLAGLAFRRRK